MPIPSNFLQQTKPIKIIKKGLYFTCAHFEIIEQKPDEDLIFKG